MKTLVIDSVFFFLFTLRHLAAGVFLHPVWCLVLVFVLVQQLCDHLSWAEGASRFLLPAVCSSSQYQW